MAKSQSTSRSRSPSPYDRWDTCHYILQCGVPKALGIGCVKVWCSQQFWFFCCIACNCVAFISAYGVGYVKGLIHSHHNERLLHFAIHYPCRSFPSPTSMDDLINVQEWKAGRMRYGACEQVLILFWSRCFVLFLMSVGSTVFMPSYLEEVLLMIKREWILRAASSLFSVWIFMFMDTNQGQLSKLADKRIWFIGERRDQVGRKNGVLQEAQVQSEIDPDLSIMTKTVTDAQIKVQTGTGIDNIDIMMTIMLVDTTAGDRVLRYIEIGDIARRGTEITGEKPQGMNNQDMDIEVWRESIEGNRTSHMRTELAVDAAPSVKDCLIGRTTSLLMTQ